MKKTFIKILGVAVTSVLFTSCLKDKKVDDQVYGTTNVSAYKW
jgi:branched-subunit amino acid transport protein AzlD